MSRDVAYRNGYLPLFAGAELVRRSGSLTQFPAENLIGTLPRLGGFVYKAPLELVGQPIQFGMSNALWEQYQTAGGVDPATDTRWPWTGWTPAGNVPETPEYLRMRFFRQLVSGGILTGSWVPGTHSGVYTDFFGGITNEPYSSTLQVSGLQIAPTGLVYPSGTFSTIDAYMEACGLPAVPNDGSEAFQHIHTVEWQTPVFGSTGNRVTMTGKSAGTVGADYAALWAVFFVIPFPAGEFDTANSLQGLYGNVDKIYARIWAADDSELTPSGVESKALLRGFSATEPTGFLTVLGMSFRDKDSLSPAEVTYVEVGGGDASLLPGTIPRRGIGFVGPTYKIIEVETVRERKESGVWVPAGSTTNTQEGLTAANTIQNIRSSTNQLVTYMTLPSVLVEQVFVPGT
jgi:hypothetical protein